MRMMRAVRILIAINAGVWSFMALLIAAGVHPAFPDGGLVRWVLSVLSLAAALGLLGFHRAAQGGHRWGYRLLLGSLSVIALLTVMDQFGWADLAVLILNLITIYLLIRSRALYLPLT